MNGIASMTMDCALRTSLFVLILSVIANSALAQADAVETRALIGLEGLKLFSIHTFQEDPPEPGCPISPAVLGSRFKEVAAPAGVQVVDRANARWSASEIPAGRIDIYVVAYDYHGVCAVTLEVEAFTIEEMVIRRNGQRHMDDFVFWQKGITMAGSKNDIQSALENVIAVIGQDFVRLWKLANP